MKYNVGVVWLLLPPPMKYNVGVAWLLLRNNRLESKNFHTTWSLNQLHIVYTGKVIVCERFKKMPSGKNCCIYICRSHTKRIPKSLWHRFPANKDKCKQWLKLLELQEEIQVKPHNYESAQDNFWMAMPETFPV